MRRRDLLLVFVIGLFVVANWQSLAVKADEEAEKEAEKAIADLTDEEIDLWKKEIKHPDIRQLRFVCYKLILDYTGMEIYVVEYYSESANITGRHFVKIDKDVQLLYCVTEKGSVEREYLFGPGKNGTHVAIEKKPMGREMKNVPEKVLRDDYRKWEFIYNWNVKQVHLTAVCENIFSTHQPTLIGRWIRPKRAVRNGVDANGLPKRFMTLICYYDEWDNNFEYCEGDNEDEVFNVQNSSGIFQSISSAPLRVEYKLLNTRLANKWTVWSL